MDDGFNRVLETFFGAAGVDVPAADETGARHFAVGGVELKLVRDPDEPESVDLEAYVGSIAGVPDRATLMEDALEANFFWEGTRGGTLGFAEGDGDDLVLSDRRDVDDLAAEGAFGAWLGGFAKTVAEWRRYIANVSTAVTDDEGGEEVSK